MPAHTDVDDRALHAKYGSKPPSKSKRLRKDVNILFYGLSADETVPLITLLRTSRLSPKGKQIASEAELAAALVERSWDMLICTVDRDKLTARQAVSAIKRLGKDIPVVQIIPNNDSKQLLYGLKNHIQAVVPIDEKELVLIHIRRELDNLENRRKLRQTEARLAEIEKRNRQLMESSKTPIACCQNTKITFANSSFLELFGIHEAQGTALTDLFIVEDQEQLSQQLTAVSSGDESELSLQLTAIRSDQSQFTAQMELSHDLSGDKGITRIQFRVEQQRVGEITSEHVDFISGLYNDIYLDKQLDLTVQKALRGGQDCSLIQIELDQYDEIRERLGLEATDQLIRAIANYLKQTVNPAHLLAQPEDKAFSIIFRDNSLDAAKTFADQLCASIAEVTASVSGMEVQSTCSIGITSINDNTPPADELTGRVKQAIADLRTSRPQGNGVRIYAAEESKAQVSSNNLAAQIKQAIEGNDFKLLFQPVVNLVSDNTEDHHYEVLVRLMNAQDEPLSPKDFMEALGDSNNMLKMDRWVIENSIKALKESSAGEHRNTLFISLSARAQADAEFINWLAELLRKEEAPAERLVFQISESDIAISPKQSRLFTQQLQKLHCKVCIKQFGSSSRYEKLLKAVHADYAKLNGKLMKELCENGADASELNNVMDALKKQNKITIAPLVENTKAMAVLWKAGVDYVQGYYLQPPREKMDYDFFAE
ncbi:EAL domain-containing protein [Neptuniibacter halophilus]|uniref:EAL domain-containing protein n=1 Tax=Neptuniibacter halophilus TaxID=651666 RepID=UPI002572C23B|nr:EAL domain-containing protein [Neptuniibacter halophilus]